MQSFLALVDDNFRSIPLQDWALTHSAFVTAEFIAYREKDALLGAQLKWTKLTTIRRQFIMPNSVRHRGQAEGYSDFLKQHEHNGCKLFTLNSYHNYSHLFTHSRNTAQCFNSTSTWITSYDVNPYKNPMPFIANTRDKLISLWCVDITIASQTIEHEFMQKWL